MDEWKELAKYLWVLLLGVIKILWDKQEDRFKSAESKMKALETVAYTKDDARERQAAVNELLEARRQDVIALHAKIDGETRSLRGDISTLSRDMNHGFSEIKTLLIDMKK